MIASPATGFSRAGKSLFALGCLMGVAGCQVTERFSESTRRYNLEAEKTQEQGMLLNILRAAEYHPLEFTGLVSVTGQAITSGGLGASIPLTLTEVVPSALAPSAQISGGPTFNVGIYETQEFYAGILSPINLQTIDYYMHSDFPHALLLNMLIDKIVVHQGPRVYTLKNIVDLTEEHTEFQSVIDDLVNLEISTEPDEAIIDIGPRLAPANLANPLVYAAIAAPGMRLAKLDVDDPVSPLSDKERQRFKAEKLDEVFQMQHVEPAYRFCFGISERSEGMRVPDSLRCEIVRRPTKPRTAVRSSSDINCGGSAAAATDAAHQVDHMTAERNLRALLTAKWKAMDATATADALPAFRPDCEVTYNFVTRSTAAIISYLGAVARGQLIQPDNPRFVMVPIGPSNEPVDSPRVYKAKLLVIQPGSGASGDPLVSVDYDGQEFWVPGDQSGGASSLVFRLVNELLILNKSARTQPATTVLSLTGAH